MNDLPPIDTCALAVELGATFVARSFSGDKKQLSAILKAALSHRGTAMIDVLSPCVTFNDHEGSTKSYAYAREHDDPIEEISFVPFFEDIEVDYEPGTAQEVELHDGSKLFLKKLDEDYDALDRQQALRILSETRRRGEFATGIIYVEPDRGDFLSVLNVVDEPLARLSSEQVRPPKAVLDEIMAALDEVRSSVHGSGAAALWRGRCDVHGGVEVEASCYNRAHAANPRDHQTGRRRTPVDRCHSRAGRGRCLQDSGDALDTPE